MSLDKKRYSMFSKVENSRSLAGLCEEDMKRIAFPDHLAESRSFNYVNKKKVILALAEYFLEKLSDLTGEKRLRVYIRDFRNWLAFYVPVKRAVIEEEEAAEQIPVHQPGAADDVRLQQLAERAACYLTEKDAAAIFYHTCKELTYEESAKKMGLAGAPGAGARFKTAAERLKRFLMENNISDLTPDNLNEEHFSLFIKFLCTVLEKKISTP